MATVKLLERTREFLDEALPNETDVDAKVRQLIQAEYLRELGRFRRTDLAFTRKYDLTFEEFIARHVTQQMAHGWEVEQDAMAWETAVGGITTIERKLRELRDLADESSA
jgi:hypothetical protein